MGIRPKRARLALCLSVAMLLAAAVPAAANTTQSYFSWPGYTPCTNGDVLQVVSYASGTVVHSVDGEPVDVFYNGSMAWYNASEAPSYTGDWLVESYEGWINDAWAECFETEDDDDDDRDGPPPPPPPPGDCYESDDPRLMRCSVEE